MSEPRPGGPGALFSRVIVGVDGRQGGRDAIALARLLLAPQGQLVLAHVHPGEPEQPHAGAAETAADGAAEPEESGGAAAFGAAGSAPAGAAEGAERGLRPPVREDALALVRRERDGADIEAEPVSVGAPSVGHGLHELADGRDADLLVVGSCHRGFLGRVLLGDDTRAALNGAACAVAVAPLGYARNLRGLTMVGVGYDGSPESVAALELARQLAAGHDAHVRVVQVVQVLSSAYAGFGGVAWGGALEAVLADAKQRLAELPGVNAEAVLGLPGEELAVLSQRVDLLVVGSRGYGPIRRLMLGSTSEYLAGHARGPLLVLPRAGAA